MKAEVHYKCASAIPFYYKHGFRMVGFSQNYFGLGHDAMILQKNLSDKTKCKTAARAISENMNK